MELFGSIAHNGGEIQRGILHELSGENILAVISISAAGFSCLRYKSEFQNTKFIMQAHGTSFDEFVSKIKSCSLKKWCGSIKNVFWFFKDANSYNKFDYGCNR
jgi:hypothetical protein